MKVRPPAALLAAEIEGAPQVLHEHGFPVPRPVDQARHCLVMELIDAFPLYVRLFEIVSFR